jgi:hypothetical protein
MAIGSVLSTTVTVKEHIVELLAASVAVYETTCELTEKVLPGVWEALRLTPGQLSLAVGGVQKTTALH